MLMKLLLENDKGGGLVACGASGLAIRGLEFSVLPPNLQGAGCMLNQWPVTNDLITYNEASIKTQMTSSGSS